MNRNFQLSEYCKNADILGTDSLPGSGPYKLPNDIRRVSVPLTINERSTLRLMCDSSSPLHCARRPSPSKLNLTVLDITNEPAPKPGQSDSCRFLSLRCQAPSVPARPSCYDADSCFQPEVGAAGPGHWQCFLLAAGRRLGLSRGRRGTQIAATPLQSLCQSKSVPEGSCV